MSDSFTIYFDPCFICAHVVIHKKASLDSIWLRSNGHVDIQDSDNKLDETQIRQKVSHISTFAIEYNTRGLWLHTEAWQTEQLNITFKVLLLLSCADDTWAKCHMQVFKRLEGDFIQGSGDEYKICPPENIHRAR